MKERICWKMESIY